MLVSAKLERFAGAHQYDWRWTAVGEKPRVGFDSKQLETCVKSSTLKLTGSLRVCFLASDWTIDSPADFSAQTGPKGDNGIVITEKLNPEQIRNISKKLGPQPGAVDHHGRDLVIKDDTFLGGMHCNIGTLVIEKSAVLMGKTGLDIRAQRVIIFGCIDLDGAGEGGDNARQSFISGSPAVTGVPKPPSTLVNTGAQNQDGFGGGGGSGGAVGIAGNNGNNGNSGTAGTAGGGAGNFGHGGWKNGMSNGGGGGGGGGSYYGKGGRGGMGGMSSGGNGDPGLGGTPYSITAIGTGSGGGGGGSGANGGGAGGSGAAGGGTYSLSAADITVTGNLNARGNTGSNGGSNGLGGGGGAGGGGSGGSISLTATNSLTINAGFWIRVSGRNGGTGGNAGAVGQSGGGGGGGGGGGVIKLTYGTTYTNNSAGFDVVGGTGGGWGLPGGGGSDSFGENGWDGGYAATIIPELSVLLRFIIPIISPLIVLCICAWNKKREHN